MDSEDLDWGQMEVTYEEIISSKPFRFTVGSDGEQREFTIHSALVAAQSGPLNALVNGQMKEAYSGHAVWENVCVSTFILFSQYAYTGDYTAVKPVVEPIPEPEEPDPEEPIPEPEEPAPEEPPPPPPPEPLSSEEEDRFWSIQKKKKHQSKRLWQRFVAASGSSANRNAPPRTFVALPNTEYEDYTNVFLSHARLYVFADCYRIPGLQSLSLARLGHTLEKFVLSKGRRKDILSLVQYCFAEDPVPDKLKDLVVLYVACEIKNLWKDDEFRQFYGAQGELPVAVTTLLLEQINEN